MALKDRKMKPQDTSAQTAAEEECREPYKVFDTKEDFEAELEKLVNEKMSEHMYGNNLQPYYSKKPEENNYRVADNYEPGMSNGRDKIIDAWREDAAKLQIAVPDFDFTAALRNDSFRKALSEGMNVFEAYREMIKLPMQSDRTEIVQNGRNARRGTGEAMLNPAKLSSKDFMAYIENRRNG